MSAEAETLDGAKVEVIQSYLLSAAEGMRRTAAWLKSLYCADI